MPILVLQIKADLENVSRISIDPATHRFCFSVKDSTSDDERKSIFVTASEEYDLSGSKGTANFVMKFSRDSKKEASINVKPIKGVTRDYTGDDDGKFVPLMGFECRGLEITAFHPEDGWNIVSASGKASWEDVDLSEREWCDFDEKAGVSVGVYKLESKITSHK